MLEPALGLRRFTGIPEALARALGERGAQAIGAGSKRLRVRVVEGDLEAAETAELSDPRAHRAGADDAEPRH